MRRLALALLCGAATALCVAAWPQAVASFEAEDITPVSSGGVQIERVQEHATDGEWALRVFFPGNEKDTWPGLNVQVSPEESGHDLLAVDVFNPQKQPVALSYRIDPDEGDPQFGGVSIPPGGPHAIEIWVKGHWPLKRIYPYLRMPREDCTLFLDNLRWANLKDQFTPLRYEDRTPVPEPTAEETGRGFIVFDRALTDVVFPGTRPAAAERIQSVDAFATPGEREPATLSLYALQDLKAVSVSFAGLPVTGEVLPIRCLDKRVTYSSSEYIQDMPVLCERRATVDVAAGTSKRFLLDLKVNEDAEPGVHEGTLSIAQDGAETVTLPIYLGVLPYRLQEPTDMLWGEYYTGPKLAATEEAKREVLRRDMEDMRAHGMTSVGLCFGFDTEKVTWKPDGSCELTFDGSTLYEEFMKLYVELGYPMPVILLSDSGQGAASLGVDLPYTSDEWGERHKTFWRTMQEEARRRGWPEVIVQPVDEPGWQDQDAKDRNVHCLRLLKQIPGMRTEQDGPGDAYFHSVAGPFADVWNYNGSIGDEPTIRKAQAEGRIITLYNCDVESYRPEVDRYTNGWFQVASKTNGSFNWAYIAYNGSPYDDQDHRTGTWMHVYPPMGDEPGGPSTGWIGAREGVDDYKYAHTLRQAISLARASGSEAARGAAEKAEQELAGIIGSIEYSRYVRSQARWTERGVAADGAKTIGGTLKQPNGWEHGEYAKARWRVARATVEVLAALGEAPAQARASAEPAGEAPLLTRARWVTTAARETPRPGVQSSRQIAIPVVTGQPVLDGALTDELWASAAKLDPFTLAAGSGKPEMQTTVLAASDGKDLFLGIACDEDKMDYITAKITQEGGPVWQDDCVEIFVDGKLDRNSYRQIMVNSLGVQGWNDSTDPKWRADSKAAAKHTDKGWSVEMAIPLADLGVSGGEFGFNVCRERRPMETMELSCWSPTGGAFGTPEAFGLASLGQTWIGGVSVPAASLGENEFTVRLENPTDAPALVAAALKVQAGNTETWRVLEQSFALLPGKGISRSYTYDLSGTEAPVLTYSLLYQGEGGTRVLAERSFSPAVMEPLVLSLRPKSYYLSETLGSLAAEVNVSPSLRADAAVVVALYDAVTGREVRQARVAPVEGNCLDAALNLWGLGEGAYDLWVIVDGPGGERIAERSERIVRLRGPFD